MTWFGEDVDSTSVLNNNTSILPMMLACNEPIYFEAITSCCSRFRVLGLFNSSARWRISLAWSHNSSTCSHMPSSYWFENASTARSAGSNPAFETDNVWLAPSLLRDSSSDASFVVRILVLMLFLLFITVQVPVAKSFCRLQKTALMHL